MTNSLSIRANGAVYSYVDLARAVRFYTETLGFAPVAAYEHAQVIQLATSSFLTLADVRYSRHDGADPKTVTTALITDELEAWYVYLTAQGVPMARPFNPGPGRPHDGFVALDPEGYFLEFERFNAHPENSRLMPQLRGLPSSFPAPGAHTPPGLGVKATVTWLYYEDLAAGARFLEEQVGLAPLVDQGFAVVYQSSQSGFIGPVQAGDGLHPFAPRKLCSLALFTDELDAWLDTLTARGVTVPEPEIELAGSDTEVVIALDPAGYTIEFTRPRATATNTTLRALLDEAETFYVNS